MTPKACSSLWESWGLGKKVNMCKARRARQKSCKPKALLRAFWQPALSINFQHHSIPDKTFGFNCFKNMFLDVPRI